MKIHVARFGKPAYGEYEAIASRFHTRLLSWYQITRDEPRVANQKQLEQAENRFLREHQGSLVVALDERGSNWSSTEFATKLKNWEDHPLTKQLAFVVGGPFGLGQAILNRADHKWSLSRAVFPADLAWVIVWEQLYRAAAINRGSPYHHA